MDGETQAALAALSDRMDDGFAEMRAGFARVDRFFELQQLQFVEWRAELRGEMAGLRTELRGEMAELRGEMAELRQEMVELRQRVDTLTERVGSLEHEVLLLRDYVTRELTGIRLELRDLRGRSLMADDDLRRDIAALTQRVDRLEERHSG
ncbi:MAG: hypothetical protein ACYC28_05365 [Longimicrobiales bacterium]